MARPTVFESAHIETARAMSFGGATDREVAAYLGVDESTVHRWKHEHPEFADALTTGKAAADRRVEHSLYLQLSDKAAAGTLTSNDLRSAWGKIPKGDWEQAAGWVRSAAVADRKHEEKTDERQVVLSRAG